MAFTRINIAVKPPQEIIEQAIEISHKISKDVETYFVLDGLNYFPHLTLYSPEFPDTNLDHVFKAVAEIASQTKSFMAAISSCNSHGGYIDLAIEKTESWEKLHTMIIEQLNPLRENHIREKYHSELKNYSPIQQEYIQNYGYSEVFTAFRPHLTITRVKDEAKAEEIVKQLHFPLHSFQVTEIAAYTMGEHGTCTDIIKEFSLQS
jgi:2'-5' RNA ligase